MLFEKLEVSNIVVYEMPFDVLIWILKQKNDWSIIIFQFSCVGFYCCWRIFPFLYILLIFFFNGPSSLRLWAYMISKTMRWCFNYILLLFRNIIFTKFEFYVFQYRSAIDLNSLSFLSFIQQHLIATRIKNNWRHLFSLYFNHSHISSFNILSFFFLLLFIMYLNPIIIWIFYNRNKSELGVCI